MAVMLLRSKDAPSWRGGVTVLINLFFIITVQARVGRNLLDEAMRALEKTTSFFAEDYSSINVDGLFGIRIGQGSINQTFEDCTNRRFHCPRDILEKLKHLNERIDLLATKAMPYIKADDSQYYNRFLYTFNAPYIVRYRIEFLGASVKEAGHDHHYNEELGDACISSLFGTFVDEKTHQKVPKCTITDECWEMMTSRDRSRYAVTHQLLYFIFAETVGCLDKMEKRLKSSGAISMREFQRSMCGQIFAESLDLSNSGVVAPAYQDLFAEQCLLCGLLGFADFYSEKWLHMLVSWQSPSGCFGKGKEEEFLTADQRHLLSKMQEEAKYIDQSSATQRKLLREKVMTGGCYAHKSGLSFGLLGGYIRFYVNTLYGPTRLYKRGLPSAPHPQRR